MQLGSIYLFVYLLIHMYVCLSVLPSIYPPFFFLLSPLFLSIHPYMSTRFVAQKIFARIILIAHCIDTSTNDPHNALWSVYMTWCPVWILLLKDTCLPPWGLGAGGILPKWFHYNDVTWHPNIPSTWLMFARLSRWTTKTCKGSAILAYCEGNPMAAEGFPSHKASNVEGISMSWCHHMLLNATWLPPLHLESGSSCGSVVEACPGRNQASVCNIW